MSTLNNLFTKKKSAIKQLIDYAERNGNELPDHIFSQACEELDITEGDLMFQMIHEESAGYEWIRTSTGWILKDNENPED